MSDACIKLDKIWFITKKYMQQVSPDEIYKMRG